eukprot:4234531-Prymnesium_polylepis.1
MALHEPSAAGAQQRAAAAREESGSDIESSKASEEEENNSNDWRENDEEVDPESGQSERSSPSTLQPSGPATSRR